MINMIFSFLRKVYDAISASDKVIMYVLQMKSLGGSGAFGLGFNCETLMHQLLTFIDRNLKMAKKKQSQNNSGINSAFLSSYIQLILKEPPLVKHNTATNTKFKYEIQSVNFGTSY